MGGTLRYGPLGSNCVHLCVDMQRLFAEESEWAMPWMRRVLPNVVEIVRHHPARTIFTRFVPAKTPGHGLGTWKRYYERWASMTLDHVGRDRVELVRELAEFVPPATTFDKWVYSPWFGSNLHARLSAASVDTLIITGGETDVCVLATVLGAIDRGYRVVITADALCSSSDQTHEASLALYENRFTQQVEVVSTEVVLAEWIDKPG